MSSIISLAQLPEIAPPNRLQHDIRGTQSHHTSFNPIITETREVTRPHLVLWTARIPAGDETLLFAQSSGPFRHTRI